MGWLDEIEQYKRAGEEVTEVLGAPDMEGEPLWRGILLTLQWKTNHRRLTEQGAKIMDAISKAIEGDDTLVDRVPGTGCVQRACEMFNSRFDDTFGGFGDAPKFPQPGWPWC